MWLVRLLNLLFPFLQPLSFGGAAGGAVEQPKVNTNDDQLRQMQEDAARKEAERQARIKEGMRLISSMFDGAPVQGYDQATAGYDPNRTYYYANGQEFIPTMPGEPPELVALRAKLEKLKAGPQLTPNAQERVTQDPRFASRGMQFPGQTGMTGPDITALEKQIGALYDKHQASLRDGTYAYQEGTRLANEGKLFNSSKRQGGFDDSYMQGIRQKYYDYALPQIDQQFADARRDTSYSLARQGLLNSSIAGDSNSRLAQRKANALTEMNVNADAAVSDFASKLEQQRQQLVAQLNSSADPAQTAALASAAMSSLQKQQQYAPVENAFNNATAGFRAYQEAAANAPYAAISGFKSGLNSRGRVVG